MIIDAAKELNLIENTGNDEGLTMFDIDKQNMFIDSTFDEILKDSKGFLNKFITEKGINRDKFMFTLSTFAACYSHTITSESDLKRLERANEIYVEWLTSNNEIYNNNDFLKISLNHLTLPFKLENDNNSDKYMSILFTIHKIFKSIIENKLKESEKNKEMIEYISRLLIAILHTIVSNYQITNIRKIYRPLFELLLLIIMKLGIQAIQYKLFFSLFSNWINQKEIRNGFITITKQVQTSYIKNYINVHKDAPFTFIFPYEKDDKYLILINEKELRLFWLVLLQLLSVKENVSAICLLELTKLNNDLFIEARENIQDIDMIHYLYTPLMINSLMYFDHKVITESLCYSIVTVLDFYEKNLKYILQNKKLLSKMIYFCRKCLESQCLDIVVVTLSNLTRILDQRSDELIVLYEVILKGLLQMTIICNKEEKIISDQIVKTFISLEYYQPLLFDQFKHYQHDEKEMKQFEEMISTQFVIFMSIDTNYCLEAHSFEDYFQIVYTFLDNYCNHYKNKQEMESYFVNFVSSLQKNNQILFKAFSSKTFLNIYYIFNCMYLYCNTLKDKQEFIHSVIDLLIQLIMKLSNQNSSQIIVHYFYLLCKYSKMNESISLQTFVQICELFNKLQNDNKLLLRDILPHIFDYYFFYFTHSSLAKYYLNVNESEYVTNDYSNCNIMKQNHDIISSVKKDDKLMVIFRNKFGKHCYELSTKAMEYEDKIPKQESSTYVFEEIKPKETIEYQIISEFLKVIKDNEIDILLQKLPKALSESTLESIPESIEWCNDLNYIKFNQLLFNSPSSCILPNENVVTSLSNIKATNVIFHIKCKVISPHYLHELKQDSYYDKELDMLIQKSEDGYYYSEKNYHLCQFMYYFQDYNDTRNEPFDCVLFIDTPKSKQLQKEQYIIKVKTTNALQYMKMKNNFNIVLFKCYRNTGNIINTIQMEVERNIIKDNPQVLYEGISNDVHEVQSLQMEDQSDIFITTYLNHEYAHKYLNTK